MFKKISLDDFLKLTELEQVSLLFVKEQGCKYCEIAENEIKKVSLVEALPRINFFEISIDDEPTVTTKLGLTGVPAFLRIDRAGRKKLKTGFEGVENLKNFIISEIEL
jgi:thioredoxin-related protein